MMIKMHFISYQTKAKNWKTMVGKFWVACASYSMWINLLYHVSRSKVGQGSQCCPIDLGRYVGPSAILRKLRQE